ncbi:MAG: Rho termination factor N-terminal domain-containing protein [Gemmatimonadota bacterium]|nr:MAG: Rho termination factor N-terminal domain-containing protein [Gemmatimonadota bacterium]
MAYTYDELHKKTVAQLRQIAKEMEHEALRGYSTMHKADLLHALCEALSVEEHVHHEVVGIDKTNIKVKIRELKKQRDAAVEARDSAQLKVLRKRIKRLKRQIHKATV